MGLTAALLATALTFGPSVSVEVVADGPHADEATALGGWLVQRLIEEGYTIAPADQADRVLTLQADAEAVTVRGGTETFEIEPGAPAVMRLEALHRARLLLEHVQPSHPLASEVLGMRSRSEAPEGAAGALESALLQAGYVLTPRPRSGDPVLCVAHGDIRLGASLARADAACPEPTVYVSYAQLQGPDGADTIVTLIEGAFVPESSPPPRAPLLVPRSTSDEPSASAQAGSTETKRGFLSEESEFRVGADVGAVARGDVDGYARAHIRLGKLQGPGGQLHVGVIPSRSGSVRALDTTLAVGPDLRIGRRRFGAEVGLVLGALVHAYADELVRGGSASWYVGLPASVSFGRSWDRMRVHLFTEGFVTGGPLKHLRDNAPDWARSAWGIRAGLGITWGWNIK
ncbi:MAG: hypothetical protein KUG77_15440 [Nannocystaceae bacterium]|nr:hypothetical protein [Nannocystaceae bacterium]